MDSTGTPNVMKLECRIIFFLKFNCNDSIEMECTVLEFNYNAALFLQEAEADSR